jgi:hypothetical protein
MIGASLLSSKIDRDSKEPRVRVLPRVVILSSAAESDYKGVRRQIIRELRTNSEPEKPMDQREVTVEQRCERHRFVGRASH